MDDRQEGAEGEANPVMSRNVHNFWVELQVEERELVATGPTRKDGGFSLIVYQRDKGVATMALKVRGRANSEGYLFVEAKGKDGHNIFVETWR